MAKESMSKKMYANSPKLATDENGKKYIQKGPTDAEKKSAQVSDGTDGVMSDQIKQKHSSEMFDMMQRHQKEYMDTHTKQMLEAAGATGGALIDKVETDKKD